MARNRDIFQIIGGILLIVGIILTIVGWYYGGNTEGGTTLMRGLLIGGIVSLVTGIVLIFIGFLNGSVNSDF